MRYLKNGKMVEATKEMEEGILRFDAKCEIEELKKYLADTDYMAIKFAEGILSAEDYAEAREKRAAWRESINSLEELLIKK